MASTELRRLPHPRARKQRNWILMWKPDEGIEAPKGGVIVPARTCQASYQGRHEAGHAKLEKIPSRRTHTALPLSLSVVGNKDWPLAAHDVTEGGDVAPHNMQTGIMETTVRK